MAENFNTQVIADFRSNGGDVGGNFAGAPIVLVHHRGRKSGRETVSPVMFLPDDVDPAKIYIFASAAGGPKHPAWYFNLTAAGDGVVEVGTETFPVLVSEITGAERDRIYAEQVSRFPGFGEYEEKTAGIRTIPVLELRRTV